MPPSSIPLFETFEKDSVYFSKTWFDTLINHGLDGETLTFACVVRQGEVLAILPLMARDAGHLRSLGHLYTYLAGLLIVDRENNAILECLAGGLARLSVASVWIEPCDEDNVHLKSFQQAMERAGFHCERRFKFFNWIQRTEQLSFDDYLQGRPSRVLNTVNRKRRKLDRERDARFRIFIDQEIEQGLSDYNRIYRSSWKAYEQFSEFSDQLALGLAERGWLRLGILYIDGEPAAGQFWFVVHRKASIFKLAYDEKWKHYSPGSLLIAHLLRHAIDTDRVVEIDFLMGNDGYKQDWMSERRSRCGYYFSRSISDPQLPDHLITRIAKTLLSFR